MSRSESWGGPSNERKGVNLPQRLKCKICQKFKEPGQYSKNELGVYHSKPHAAKRDPNNGLVRCRVCTGAPSGELQCLGPCGKFLKLSEFSKTSRKTGGNMWCMICTSWKDSADDAVPLEEPPVGGNISQLVDDEGLVSDDGTGGYYYAADPEAGDSEDEYAPSTVTGLSKALAPNLRERAAAPISLPYNHFGALGIVDNTIDNEDNFDQTSQSSISNPFESTSSSATTMQVGNPIYYTAYDNRGNSHAQVTHSTSPRIQTSVSRSENPVQRAPAVAASNRNGWAKPVGQRNASQAAQRSEPPDLQPRSGTGQYRYDSDSDEDLM